MKISILGYSGSGKSTLARRISEKNSLNLLHLDTVQWLPNWVENDTETGKKIVAEFMKSNNWIIEGNYTKFYQNERMEQADKIIFVEFSAVQCLYRVFKRYFTYRGRSRPDMGEGCSEKIDLEFIWWVIYLGRNKAKRIQYQKIKDKYSDKIIVIKNQKQLDNYISCL